MTWISSHLSLWDWQDSDASVYNKFKPSMALNSPWITSCVEISLEVLYKQASCKAPGLDGIDKIVIKKLWNTGQKCCYSAFQWINSHLGVWSQGVPKKLDYVIEKAK